MYKRPVIIIRENNNMSIYDDNMKVIEEHRPNLYEHIKEDIEENYDKENIK